MCLFKLKALLFSLPFASLRSWILESLKGNQSEAFIRKIHFEWAWIQSNNKQKTSVRKHERQSFARRTFQVSLWFRGSFSIGEKAQSILGSLKVLFLHSTHFCLVMSDVSCIQFNSFPIFLFLRFFINTPYFDSLISPSTNQILESDWPC